MVRDIFPITFLKTNIMTQEEIEEKAKKIVLDTIKELCNTNNPVQYAELNETVYEVAMSVAKQLLINK